VPRVKPVLVHLGPNKYAILTGVAKGKTGVCLNEIRLFPLQHLASPCRFVRLHIYIQNRPPLNYHLHVPIYSSFVDTLGSVEIGRDGNGMKTAANNTELKQLVSMRCPICGVIHIHRLSTMIRLRPNDAKQARAAFGRVLVIFGPTFSTL
jgi:hypothetical protein